MEFLNVIVAALTCYAFGAVWYMIWAKPWMDAAEIERGADGKPAQKTDPVPFILAFLAALLVAGMMRHIFALSGIGTIGA